MRTQLRKAWARLAGGVAELAGRGLRWAPGAAAATCFVVAGWLIAAPLGLAVAGAFFLWADWRLR